MINFYNAELDKIDIENISFGKLLDITEYNSTLIKQDLESVVNLYNPIVHNLLDVRAARLLQYDKMINPYLDFSKRVSEIIEEWVKKQENQD